MCTTEQKALELAEDLETEYWADQKICEAADHIRRLSAENEALRAQSDSFEFKLAELVDLVSPGLDSGDLPNDAASAGVQATALRAQVEALTRDCGRQASKIIELIADLKFQEGKHREYRARLQAIHEHQRGECWYWQGDGQDHLESLVGSLPVVIRADQLRALLAPLPLTRPAAPDAKAMANRLMGWKLPKNFSPDCFISFDRAGAEACGAWPVGTNLFMVDQATEMFEYVLAAAPQPPVEVAEPSKLTPYEPTSDMLIAARERDPALPVDTIRAVWWAMWRKAAPQPEAQPTLKSCAGCGEGVTSFCRGKVTECPLHLPAAGAKPEAQPTEAAQPIQYLQESDQQLLRRFIETTEDDEGFDIGMPAVKRLADLGVVRNCGFGRYAVTMFGYWVHEHFGYRNPPLPLMTNADRDAAQKANLAAQKGGV